MILYAWTVYLLPHFQNVSNLFLLHFILAHTLHFKKRTLVDFLRIGNNRKPSWPRIAPCLGLREIHLQLVFLNFF